MSKVFTLFSGGGLVDAAIKEFGLDVQHGVEMNPDLAFMYRQNYGDRVINAKVEDVNYGAFGNNWLLLHASPSCKSFSDANINGEETEADIQAANGTARAIKYLNPFYFTLEQVRAYTKSRSFKIIFNQLINMGYAVTYDTVNAADYGVPQNRERLILTACRNGTTVGLPAKTRRIGWGEVINLGNLATVEPTAAQYKAYQEVSVLYPSTSAWLIQRRGYHGELPKPRDFYTPAPTVTCALFTDGKGANRRSFYDVVTNSGEWLTLSMRDMARLQTLPEWYVLPEETAIAGMIVGNGVPCTLYKAVLSQLLRHYQALGQ